ncbi:MAG: DUF4270 domain-containing protein [Bacteroidota bacterium]|nr:DUF4270 domain-containing protein [Bacteroidota bacterium]
MNRIAIRLLFLALFSAGIAFTLNSCKKEAHTLGMDILPPSDTLSVKQVDTVTVVAYSVLQDSVRTDKTSTSCLGSLVDPVFGTTTASFYTQFYMAADAPDFGTNPVVDSLIVSFRYSSIYGDTNSLQTIRVYELSEDLNADSAYYSNQNKRTYSTLLGEITFKPDLKDSVKVGTVKQGPQLRINLSKMSRYLANKLMYAPKSVLTDNTTFLPFFKGLYFETVKRNSKGALLFFDMDAAASRMAIYFHNQSDGDSLSFYYSISSSGARFNHFDHNKYLNAAPDFRREVVYHDTSLGKKLLYLQGLGGVRIRLRFPYIKNLNKLGTIAINNAELVLKNYETDTTLAPPASLNMYKVDSLGRYGYITDYTDGSTYFGGDYDQTKRVYRFHLTRHIQEILLGTAKNYDMYLMVNNPTASSLIKNRIILNGTKPSVSSDRLQLKITYTKLH